MLATPLKWSSEGVMGRPVHTDFSFRSFFDSFLFKRERERRFKCIDGEHGEREMADEIRLERKRGW